MKFRLLILTTLTLFVGGFLAAIVVVSDRVHEREAHAELAADLDRSTIALEELTALRSTTLAGALHVTAEEPRLKAVVATEDIEHATVLDVALELRRTMHADLFLLVDGSGRLMADTLAPAEQGARLEDIPLVAQALREGAGEAVWISGTQAYQVAARRMAFGDEVVGVVVAGRTIDDEVATSIARQSGSVVLITIDGRPIASAGADRATLDALAAGSTTETSSELALADGRWVAQRHALPGYAGEHRLEYVVARSLDGALAASRALSQRFQQLAAIAFLVAIGLALALARTLSRPLDRLITFARAIGAGELEARAPIRGPREVRALGAAMNAMATQLAGSRAELEAANQSLERTVELRTLHLREANLEIAEMFDHLDDAVLIVGRSLTVEPRCSQACTKLFGTDEVAGADIRELLFSPLRLRIDAEALGLHAFVFENGFGESELQWELNQHLLLREVTFQHPVAPYERTFSLRYAPLFDDAGEIARVMLVITDVTELLALRRTAELEQRRAGARVEALLAFSRCTRREALQFVDESVARMIRVFEGVDRWIEHRERDVLAGVMRELHTLKGNARALRLKEISSRAHALEGAVQQMLHPGAETGPTANDELAVLLSELRPALLALEDQIAVHANVADELLRRQSDRPRVDISRMQTWLGALSAEVTGSTRTRVETMSALLEAESAEEVGAVGRMLGQQRAMIEEVGLQLGKQVRLDIETGSELFVTPTVASGLRDAFVHAIRNAIDHGIEPPEERVRAGKPATGVLALRWARGDEHWLLRISDDGRGIDPGAIAELGRKQGLLAADETPSPERICELLFAPSFTSKALADDISGRGVGLDAIRTGLGACGVRVRLTSEPGVGTTLELRVPVAAVRFEEEAGIPRVPGDAHVRAAA